MNSTAATREYADQAGTYAESAADSTDQAIRKSQNVANSAFDRLSGKVSDLKSQAAPLINQWSEQALDAKRRGVEAVRDTSQQLREKAYRATDDTAAYIKDEPFKSILIAVATGAVLMGLLSLLGRSESRNRL